MPNTQTTHKTLSNNDSDQNLAAFDEEEALKHTVTGYRVVEDRGNVCGAQLSPLFATLVQAKAALTIIKKQHPRAGVRRETYWP